MFTHVYVYTCVCVFIRVFYDGWNLDPWDWTRGTKSPGVKPGEGQCG